MGSPEPASRAAGTGKARPLAKPLRARNGAWPCRRSAQNGTVVNAAFTNSARARYRRVHVLGRCSRQLVSPRRNIDFGAVETRACARRERMGRRLYGPALDHLAPMVLELRLNRRDVLLFR